MTAKQNLQVGSFVIAKRETAICAVGERGVCYEVYELAGRPGWSFIFEHGGYDGFSPGDVDLILEVTGEVCQEVANYQFKNVGRLCQDFHHGRFAVAFQVEPEDSPDIGGGDLCIRCGSPISHSEPHLYCDRCA